MTLREVFGTPNCPRHAGQGRSHAPHGRPASTQVSEQGRPLGSTQCLRGGGTPQKKRPRCRGQRLEGLTKHRNTGRDLRAASTGVSRDGPGRRPTRAGLGSEIYAARRWGCAQRTRAIASMALPQSIRSAPDGSAPKARMASCALAPSRKKRAQDWRATPRAWCHAIGLIWSGIIDRSYSLATLRWTDDSRFGLIGCKAIMVREGGKHTGSSVPLRATGTCGTNLDWCQAPGMLANSLRAGALEFKGCYSAVCQGPLGGVGLRPISLHRFRLRSRAERAACRELRRERRQRRRAMNATHCLQLSSAITHCCYASCRARRDAGNWIAAAFDAGQSNSVRTLSGYADSGYADWGASRPDIRLNFSVRAARFIRSNTRASVSLGDAWGYADATALNATVRNSGVRNWLIRSSGARLRNATALDTQLTQRHRNVFRTTERTSVENPASRAAGPCLLSVSVAKGAIPAGTVRRCCVSDSPGLAVSFRRGTLTTASSFCVPRMRPINRDTVATQRRKIGLHEISC
jgi:hypothetical protein